MKIITSNEEGKHDMQSKKFVYLLEEFRKSRIWDNYDDDFRFEGAELFAEWLDLYEKEKY